MHRFGLAHGDVVRLCWEFWRGTMQRTFLKLFLIALLMNLPAYGQSLGEIARENREKQKTQETSGVRPRIITNKDLPADPEGYEKPRQPEPDAATNTPVEHRFEEQRFGQERAPGQWKRQILTQEKRVGNFTARLH